MEPAQQPAQLGDGIGEIAQAREHDGVGVAAGDPLQGVVQRGPVAGAPLRAQGVVDDRRQLPADARIAPRPDGGRGPGQSLAKLGVVTRRGGIAECPSGCHGVLGACAPRCGRRLPIGRSIAVDRFASECTLSQPARGCPPGPQRHAGGTGFAVSRPRVDRRGEENHASTGARTRIPDQRCDIGGPRNDTARPDVTMSPEWGWHPAARPVQCRASWWAACPPKQCKRS